MDYLVYNVFAMKTSPHINPIRETRLFFWFLTLVLGGMYVFVLFDQPEIRQPLRLVIFTVLFGIHLALHWMLQIFVERPGWTLRYLLVQGVLACGVAIISGHEGMLLGVFMALVGEAIGVYGATRRGFGIAVYYLLLSLICFVLIFSPSKFPWQLLGIAPLVIFIVMYVEMYNRQMNANIRAQELLDELQTANEQLRAYADQVEDLTIANERQRMARELHDTLSQGLAGLILQLEAVDAHLESDRPEKAHTIIQETMKRARNILTEARQAIDDLRNAAPNDLEVALRQEIARFSEATDIPCEMSISLPTSLPAKPCEPVLRIISEALTNIARHSQAKQARVNIVSSNDELHITIQDDGCGFDLTAVQPGHYGLLGMRERARLAGGKLKIESTPKAGTTIVISIPIEQN